jgi:hypothetical protein
MVGVFDARTIARIGLVGIVKQILMRFQLDKKVIVYVKDQGGNLATLIPALTSLVTCNVLGLEKPNSKTCLVHVMSKVCQHATTEEKICKNMKKVSCKNGTECTAAHNHLDREVQK